jgi:hypothetical protein
MKRLKPEAVQEFRDKAIALQNEFPILPVAQITVQDILSEAFNYAECDGDAN